MQLSAVLNIFIVETELNSIFTNDLKRIYFFRKIFIVTDLVSFNYYKTLASIFILKCMHKTLLKAISTYLQVLL